MKERPILFSAPMVRALLDGRKTQTRRLVKRPFPSCSGDVHPSPARYGEWFQMAEGSPSDAFKCPYGQPGDRLWVRETWRPIGDAPLSECVGPGDVMFAASVAQIDGLVFKFRPSIHMPRWASRITLEVTGVRVERLQDISDDDCCSEGVDGPMCAALLGKSPLKMGHCERVAYAALWESINGAGSWAANPWVWVVEFKRVTP